MRIRHKETGEIVEIGADREFERFLARRKRRLVAWENALQGLKWERFWIKRVSLTYRPGVEWEPCHISDYRVAVKKQLGGLLVAYMWWAELQVERQVVHYHMVMVIRKGPGDWLPLPDKSGMWPHGMSSVEDLERPTVGYALSRYGTKREQMEGSFPKGMHKFAVWISEDLVGHPAYWMFRLSVFPRWLETPALLVMIKEGFYCAWVLMPRRDEWGQWWIGKRKVISPWERLSWFDCLHMSTVGVE
jgi:hypothetical protein